MEGSSTQNTPHARGMVRPACGGGFSPSPKGESGRPSAVRADGPPLCGAAHTPTAFLPAPVQTAKSQPGPRPRTAFSGAPAQTAKSCIWRSDSVVCAWPAPKTAFSRAPARIVRPPKVPQRPVGGLIVGGLNFWPKNATGSPGPGALRGAKRLHRHHIPAAPPRGQRSDPQTCEEPDERSLLLTWPLWHPIIFASGGGESDVGSATARRPRRACLSG